MQEIVFQSGSEDTPFGVVVSWRKQEGDHVEAGEAVIEVEVDKLAVEISAPATGRLVEIRALEGDEVENGDCLATIAPS